MKKKTANLITAGLIVALFVVLYVLEGNEKAAGFYRHMGFEPTGRIQLDHTPYGTLRDLEMVCRRERKEN